MDVDLLTNRTVDDLLLDDAVFDTDDDPFADKPPRNAERDDKPTLSPRKRKADEEIFGKVDEEVKITKQRKIIPKLDAERLLSEPGIPKMRKLVRSGDFKKKLRLKGKGYEFTDAAKLLNYYQMWLDNLYPRAKFADAVQLVEKAGHTKRMQSYRKIWINEGKPGYVRGEDVDAAMERQDAEQIASGPSLSPREQINTGHMEDEDSGAMFFGAHDDEEDGEVEVGNKGGPDDDELEALMAQGNDTSMPSAKKGTIEVDSEEEDDLDALLAQDRSAKQNSSHVVTRERADEDELEAMLNQEQSAFDENHKEQVDDTALSRRAGAEQDELDVLLNDDIQEDVSATVAHATPDKAIEEEVNEDDMVDLDILLNKQQNVPEPELPAMEVAGLETNAQSTTDALPNSEEVPELDNVVSSSPIPNVQTDELDDLMDEHDASLGKQHADMELVEEFMSSSPIPNRESQ